MSLVRGQQSLSSMKKTMTPVRPKTFEVLRTILHQMNMMRWVNVETDYAQGYHDALDDIEDIIKSYVESG